MLVEALILGGQNRADQRLGHLIDVDDCSALLAKLSNQLAVSAVNSEWNLRLIIR